MSRGHEKAKQSPHVVIIEFESLCEVFPCLFHVFVSPKGIQDFGMPLMEQMVVRIY